MSVCGVEGEVLAVLVDWCYTGRLVLSLVSVAGVLSADTQRCNMQY